MARDYVKNQRGSRSTPPSSTSSGPSGMVWLLVGVLMGLIIAGIFYVKNQHSVPVPEISSNGVTSSATAAAKPQTSQNTAASNQSLQTQFDFYNVLPSQKVVGPSGDEDTSDITNQNNSLNNPTPTTTPSQNAAQPNSTTTPPTTTPSTTPLAPTASSNTTASSSSNSNQNSQAVQTTTPVSAPFSNQTTTRTTTTASSNNATTPTATTPVTPKDESYILQIATFSQFTAADQLKAQLSLAGFEVNITQIERNGKALERVWVGPFHSQDDAEAVQKQLQDNQITSKLLKSS